MKHGLYCRRITIMFPIQSTPLSSISPQTMSSSFRFPQRQMDISQQVALLRPRRRAPPAPLTLSNSGKGKYHGQLVAVQPSPPSSPRSLASSSSSTPTSLYGRKGISYNRGDMRHWTPSPKQMSGRSAIGRFEQDHRINTIVE